MNTPTVYSGGLLLPLADRGRTLSHTSSDDFWFFSVAQVYWERKFEDQVRKLLFVKHFERNKIDHVSAIKILSKLFIHPTCIVFPDCIC